jgi:hypothetical protein
MQQKKNPLLIVLAVCGSCMALALIVGGVLFVTVMHKSKGLVSGTMNMMRNPPKFLADIKSKNYNGASALFDPTVQDKYTAAKIQQLEESVEKKLGPLQSYPPQFSSQNQTTNTDASKPGSMPSMAYAYTYKLTYKKGTATATFQFENKDLFNPTGLITNLKIEPDAPTKQD